MSTFIKIDRYYVNLDSVALVEELEEIYMVRLNVPAITDEISISKTSVEGLNLIRALRERMAK